MIVSIKPRSFTMRSLSVLRSVGGWMMIHPEQTYVATSIQGLGDCKSTYCRPQRRELPAAHAMTRIRVAPVLAALVAMGVLSACANYRPMIDINQLADGGQSDQDFADCQNYAAPVSPGASAGAGALLGISLGAVPGAAVKNRELALDEAHVAAIDGVAVDGSAAAATQARIVRNCMNGRGYVVLN